MPIDQIRDRVQNPRSEGFGKARNAHDHALAHADRERWKPPGAYEEHYQPPQQLSLFRTVVENCLAHPVPRY